jgi:hypothetical protein
LFELPVTTAANCEEAPRVTVVAPLRSSDTVGGGGGGVTSVMVRLRATVVSAALVAVMITFEALGWFAGAV